MTAATSIAGATERLTASGLTAGYGGPPVVHGIDMRVAPGEVVCLLGPNGAGKSTTLGAMTGLVAVSGGSVRLDGVEVDLRRAHRVARLGIAHVPEDRSLFGSLTVRQHLALARRRRGPATPVTDAELLHWFPALDRLMGATVGRLSGGEQQMVAIARGLAPRPAALLIDEMSLGLAPIIVADLLATLRELADSTGLAVLLVEQHVVLALDVADRAYVMSRGRITFDGDADELAADDGVLVDGYLGAPAAVDQGASGRDR